MLLPHHQSIASTLCQLCHMDLCASSGPQFAMGLQTCHACMLLVERLLMVSLTPHPYQLWAFQDEGFGGEAETFVLEAIGPRNSLAKKWKQAP